MKKQKEKHILTNQQGFTLAELLVVVAIIGILVAISVPVFAAQLKEAGSNRYGQCPGCLCRSTNCRKFR